MPAILGLKIQNISVKIAYLREIGLDFIVLEDTMMLMQSVQLTYARYEFLKEKGIKINKQNYSYLFRNAKDFKKQFDISKEQLLEKYNFYKYLEKKQNVSLIMNEICDSSQINTSVNLRASFVDDTVEKSCTKKKDYSNT